MRAEQGDDRAMGGGTGGRDWLFQHQEEAKNRAKPLKMSHATWWVKTVFTQDQTEGGERKFLITTKIILSNFLEIRKESKIFLEAICDIMVTEYFLK